jgi:hypothetical protein
VSEAEIAQAWLASVQVIFSVFSMFFSLASAYIAGLYFFLHRAPLALRLLAFFLLSVGLLFLGASALMQQRMQEGLVVAWAKLPSAAISVEAVRNPVALPVPLPPGTSLLDIGIAMGWITATSVYLVLGYLTFFYRWRSEGAGANA